MMCQYHAFVNQSNHPGTLDKLGLCSARRWSVVGRCRLEPFDDWNTHITGIILYKYRHTQISLASFHSCEHAQLNFSYWLYDVSYAPWHCSSSKSTSVVFISAKRPFELITALHLFAVIAHRGGQLFQHLLYHFLPWHQTTPGSNQVLSGPMYRGLHGTFTTAPSPGVYLRSLMTACHVALSPLNVQSCRIFGHLEKFLFTSYLHIEKDPLLCIGPHLSTEDGTHHHLSTVMCVRNSY